MIESYIEDHKLLKGICVYPECAYLQRIYEYLKCFPGV